MQKKKGLILIADDDSRYVESLAMLLDNIGYDVLTAEDGAKAAGLLVTHPIDLLLLDLHLPIASGQRIIEYIRNKGLRTRVIALSGEPLPQHTARSLKRSVDHFLNKPVSAELLMSAIADSMQRLARSSRARKGGDGASARPLLHRLLFDISPSLMFLLDARGNFRLTNKAFRRSLGYRDKDLLGRHWSILVDEETMARAQHVFEERRRHTNKSSTFELKLKRHPPQGATQGNGGGSILVAIQTKRIYGKRSGKKIFWGTYAIARDITRLSRLAELERYREFHDPLTGLPNQLLFDDYLSFSISQAASEHLLLGVLHIRLDDLKQINEEHGHEAGDHCIRSTVSRLKSQIRKDDTLSRVDGSEFALLLPNIRAEAAITRLQTKLGDRLIDPVELEGRQIPLGISIGLSLYPRDGQEPRELLHRARGNRHRVVLATPSN